MKYMIIVLPILFFLAISWVSPASSAPVALFPKFSDYGMFKDATPYEVATPLFSDYAEKERKIFVPFGKKVVFDREGIGSFPEGTVLFKTFILGRLKMETRVLLKTAVGWEAGTYVWDDAQSEAYLRMDGDKKKVSWTDEEGRLRSQTYYVPRGKDCGSCHGGDAGLRPIGYTSRELPGWNDVSISLEKRVRAYMDMNCAHCHNPEGMCKKSELRLGFELSLEQSGILKFKKQIVRFMQNGRMPLLGTHMVDREGVELVAEYIATLK
jgi:mono/diheme cytochrome c family protein